MDPIDPDLMESITENLVRAKETLDRETKKTNEEKLEKDRRLEEQQLKEKEEIEYVKELLQNLAGEILGTNQIAEWTNPNEEDRGENYFAVEKDLTDKIEIYLWSDGIGINFTPLAFEEVKTAALARMIKRRLDWIAANSIHPVVQNC